MTFIDQHYLCPNGGIYFMPAAEAEAIAAEGYDGPALPPPEWQPVTPEQAEAIMHPPAPEPTLEQAQAARLRLNDANWALLVLADIIAAFAIFWPLYLVGLLKGRPLPWATISTQAAAWAASGVATWPAAAIDALFLALTSQRDHCARSFAQWARPMEAK